MNIFEQSTEYRLAGFPQKLDQGERGTCAAFSIVSMLEYYLGFKEKLSPQFVYACSHIDNENDGTELEELFKNVKRFGICRYADWPYNKTDNGNQSQISDPELLKKLPVIRFDDLELQMLKTDPPRGIEEYKSILSGMNGKKPSPVIVGCQIFRNTFAESGWMKLPDSVFEQSLGGHAMLVYGWKDTPGKESAGYFFAQNSWNGNNHIKIPFEYIENHAIKAGCFAADAIDAGMAEEPKKTETAPAEEKETLPMQENTDKKELSADLIEIKNDFFSSQKKNMMRGKYSYPGIKLPFPHMLGAYWNVKASSFDQPENFRNPEGFSKYLREKGIGHLYGEVLIFRIQIKKQFYYHLISAFLFRYDGREVDAKDLDLLLHYYNDVYSPSCRNKALHTILTIGTMGKFAESCRTTCDPAMFLCERNDLGVWLFQIPDAECGWITQEFFSHILPGDLVPVIKSKLESWNPNEKIDLKTIKESLGVSEKYQLYDRTVESALDILFQSGKYAKNKKGNIVPVAWNLPPGYKVQRRYSPPTRRQYAGLIIWLVVTIILLAIQLYTSKVLGIPLPYHISSLLLIVLWSIARFKRGKAIQSFRYGDNI